MDITCSLLVGTSRFILRIGVRSHLHPYLFGKFSQVLRCVPLGGRSPIGCSHQRSLHDPGAKLGRVVTWKWDLNPALRQQPPAQTILVNRSSSICMNILPQTGVVVVKVQLVASQYSFHTSTIALGTLPKTLTKRNAIARFPTRRSGFSAFVTTVCARFPLVIACHIESSQFSSSRKIYGWMALTEAISSYQFSFEDWARLLYPGKTLGSAFSNSGFCSIRTRGTWTLMTSSRVM